MKVVSLHIFEYNSEDWKYILVVFGHSTMETAWRPSACSRASVSHL